MEWRTDWERYSTELKSVLPEVPRTISDLNTLEIAIKLSYGSNCRPTRVRKVEETHW